MSSFVVKDKTINRILTFLSHCKYRNDILSSEIRTFIEKDTKKLDLTNNKDLSHLGGLMLEMNHNAVDYRYNTITKEDNTTPKFEFKEEETDIYQTLKSLHCYLYQCSEGNIDKSRFYKMFRHIADAIESSIIHNLAEYKRGDWD